LSPDGHLLFSLTGDGVVRLWRYPGRGLVATSPTDPLDMMALSPDGHILAVPDALRGISLYDPSTGRLVNHIATPTQPTDLAFIGDSILAISQADGTLSMVTLETGHEVESYQDPALAYPNYSVTSTDGRVFARWDHTSLHTLLSVYGLSSDQPLLRLGRYSRPDFLELSGDGRFLAVARNRFVDVWDLQLGEIRTVLEAKSREVGSLAFTPENVHLVAASGDVWELSDGSPSASFDSTTDVIALSPNGEVILGRDGTMWSQANGRPLDMLRNLRAPAVDFAFTPDGRYLIWQTAGGVIEVWGLEP
jgi:WD40 repeat protein